MRERKRAGLFVALLTISTVAAAQSSASYRLSEHALNSGGSPDGDSPASASYRMSLIAIGEIATGLSGPSGPSYGASGGFASAYPAPGEVTGLSFEDAVTLAWNPDRSAGTYNLYRDPLGSLSGLGYGACLQSGLSGAGATDADIPAAGGGFFYLVTVENRLREEGTKGTDGGGAERAGNACP